jgi:hypothetical protein
VASDTLEFIQGDANIVLTGVVFDEETSEPVDLTGYSMTLFYWNRDDGELRQTLVPVATDALKGEYEVILIAECLEEPGNFEFEMQLTKGLVIQTMTRRQRAVVKSQRG